MNIFKPDLILLHAPSVYDFRKEPIMFGPISDVVPSTAVFEMYPVGFSAISEYLGEHGLKVRIINLAFQMLEDPSFDAEKLLQKLSPVAFGIDLHWLPHAQGSLEIAGLCKKHHPHIPVIMGGYSATYFHEELIAYPQVDVVVRGVRPITSVAGTKRPTSMWCWPSVPFWMNSGPGLTASLMDHRSPL